MIYLNDFTWKNSLEKNDRNPTDKNNEMDKIEKRLASMMSSQFE